MSTGPWIKWFAGDFLNGVSDLEPGEGWVYTIALNLIYDHGAPWPLNLERLARRCRMRPTACQKALDALYDYGKLALVDGCLTNRKAEETLKSRQKVGEKSAEAAAARWDKAGRKPNENNARDYADASPKQCQTDAYQKLEAREEGISKDILVGSAEPMPTQPALLADEGPAPAKPRFTPTKAELDAIWEITPKPGRERSSRKDLERALVAAMRRGHDPASVAAGVRAAYASTTYAGDHAKGVHRLIEADRWQTFVEEAAPAPAPAAWSGPWQLRAAVVDVAGEDVARGYVDPSVWRAEDRALVVRNAFMADRLRREAGPTLDRLKVNIVVSEGVAA